MIHFFGELKKTVFTVQTTTTLSTLDIQKLEWLFGNQPKIEHQCRQNLRFLIDIRSLIKKVQSYEMPQVEKF